MRRRRCWCRASREPSRAASDAATSRAMSARVSCRFSHSASCSTFMTVCCSAMICACRRFSVAASPTANRRPYRSYPSSKARRIRAPERSKASPTSSLSLSLSSHLSLSLSLSLSPPLDRCRCDRDGDGGGGWMSLCWFSLDRWLAASILSRSSLISLSCLKSRFCCFRRSLTRSQRPMDELKVPIMVEQRVAMMNVFWVGRLAREYIKYTNVSGQGAECT